MPGSRILTRWSRPTSRYADVLAWLDEQGAPDPDLRTAWVGGSAATGGWDAWSDLDVETLCTPGTSTSVCERLLAALRETFAPTSVWELPESTYPDGRQCFVTFDPSLGALDAPTRVVDLVVWEATEEHRRPLVRFDPDGLPVLRHDEETAMHTTMAETVADPPAAAGRRVAGQPAHRARVSCRRSSPSTCTSR